MSDITRFLLEFLYQYISFYPCVLLCSLPFIQSHPQAMRKMARVFAVVCIPAAATPAVLYAFFHIGSTAVFVALLFMAGSFFYYRKAVNEGLHKLLFIFFLVTHMVCLVTETECAAVSLSAVLLIRGSRPLSFLLTALLRAVAYIVIWLLINRLITPRLVRIRSTDMKGLWLLPIVFTAVSVYRVSHHTHNGTYYNRITEQARQPAVSFFVLLPKLLE